MNRDHPNWRAGTYYGALSAATLRQCFVGFSPIVGGTPEANSTAKCEFCQKPQQFQQFLDAFAALIRDSSLSWREKAQDFLEWSIHDQGAKEYFRELWQQIADGRPYPLDEQGSSPGTQPDEQKK